MSPESLLSVEREYKAIFDASIDGLIVLAPAGVVVDANAAARRMHGYCQSEFLGMDPRHFIHPDDRQLFDQFLETVLAGRPFRVAGRDVRKDGTIFDVEVHGSQITFRGKPHLLAVVRDVTERNRAERLLASRNKVLERLAKGASLKEVLETLVTAVEGVGQDMLGSVLLLDAKAQCLRHGAAPSLPDFYNNAIDGVQVGPTVGSCGTAAYRGQRVVVEDVMTDRLWANYRDLAAKAGLAPVGHSRFSPPAARRWVPLPCIIGNRTLLPRSTWS